MTNEIYEMKIEIAQRKHKTIVVKLIADAFATDPQIVVYTDGNQQKIELIASRAFEICMKYNTVFITDDLNAVAICHPSVHSDFSFRILWENIKFPFVFGINSLSKLMKIEKMIFAKKQTPQSGLYLWFLAANPAHKGQGHGSMLLNYLDKMTDYKEIILETSNTNNIPYYQKRGYEKYDFLEVNTTLSITLFKKNIA
jgi:ribosomal protein S18 acetylase RimI-like enzyme